MRLKKLASAKGSAIRSMGGLGEAVPRGHAAHALHSRRRDKLRRVRLAGFHAPEM